MPALIHLQEHYTVAIRNPVPATANGSDKNLLLYASTTRNNSHQILFHNQDFLTHRILLAKTPFLPSRLVALPPAKNQLVPTPPGHNGIHQYPFPLSNTASLQSLLFSE